MIFLLVFFFTMLLVFVFFLFSYKVDESDESISPYECGFNFISGSRMNFSFRFFLLSILFLIFDVEISLMLPLPYVITDSDILIHICVFMMILFWGLIYEMYYGALTWMELR